MGVELGDSSRYLSELEVARESLLKVSRDVTLLSKRLVSYSIRGLRSEAYEVRERLTATYRELLALVSQYPELYYSNLFYSVASEYAEAVQLLSVIFEGRLLTAGELGVHPVPYVLSLADLVGELKRASLEALRRGVYDESLRYLDVAEGVYEALESLGVSDAVVPGLRRKLDIYRKVIDDWKELLLDLRSRAELSRLYRELARSLSDISRGT